MRIELISAFSDNYIALAVCDGDAVLIDPGDAAPALAKLRADNLNLSAVLVTHRHSDHIGGVRELQKEYPAAKIIAPQNCGIANAVICKAGDSVSVLQKSFRIIAAPGHTLEHIVFFGDKILFAGDTLFAAGCGRVFEGTMKQMSDSLQKLAALPDDTTVYCGHEYTAANIRFALAVEPDNQELQKRAAQVFARRKQHLPTIPFSLKMEKETNPFMRLEEPSVIAAAEKHGGQKPKNKAEVFAILRRWKDSF